MQGARPKRKASLNRRSWANENDEDEVFHSAESDEGADDVPNESDAEQEDQQPSRKRARAAPKAKAKTPAAVKGEPGEEIGSGSKGKKGGATAAARRRSAAEAAAGPGSARTAAAAAGGRRGAAAPVTRIPIERRDVTKMNEKLRHYQDEAADAEMRLATLLSRTESEELVARVVRTMLCKQHEKPGVPVKRQELNDVITAGYKQHAAVKKFPALVMRVAQARIISALGIEMQEVQRMAAGGGGKKGRDASQQAGASTQTYVLRSVLPPALRRALVDDPTDDAPTAFKMMVLALIHLNGGHIELDELWRHLRMVGVDREDREHPQFGKPEDALKELEKTRHVVRTQIHGAGGAVPALEWGENATSEIGVEGIDHWIEQEFANAPGFGGGAGEGAAGGAVGAE